MPSICLHITLLTCWLNFTLDWCWCLRSFAVGTAKLHCAMRGSYRLSKEVPSVSWPWFLGSPISLNNFPLKNLSRILHAKEFHPFAKPHWYGAWTAHETNNARGLTSNKYCPTEKSHLVPFCEMISMMAEDHSYQYVWLFTKAVLGFSWGCGVHIW